MQIGQPHLVVHVEHTRLAHLGQPVVILGLRVAQIALDRVEPCQLGLVDFIVVEPWLAFGLGPEPACIRYQRGTRRLEPFVKEIIQQSRIGEIDRLRKQVSRDRAACGLIGLLADKERAAVTAGHRFGGKRGFQLRLGDRLPLDLLEKRERQRRILRQGEGLGRAEGDLACGERISLNRLLVKDPVAFAARMNRVTAKAFGTE